MWPEVAGPVYYAGIGVHAVLAAIVGQRLRLRPYVPLAISACYLLAMTVGAKALFDLRAGTFSAAELLRREHYLEGGLWASPPAYLALAAPVVLLITRERRRALDLVALAAPVPIAFCKLACLCRGCCHGTPSSLPWAITFPRGNPVVPGGVPLHPTQVYDMLLLVGTAALLAWLNRPRWRGTLLLWLVLVCGLGRFLSDFTQAHPPGQDWWGPLTPFQWLCMAAGLVCALALIVHARRTGGRVAEAAVPARPRVAAGQITHQA